jgi:O-antigen/teichoic acid export membrane protein
MRSVSLSHRTRELSAAALFTDGESTFRNAKLRPLTLIAYKAFADVAGKGSLLVITLVAARRLSPWAFGVFGLGTALGWMVSVIADFGVQMHVARAVARAPDAAASLLARWWRVRTLATAAVVGILTMLLLLWRAEAGLVVPLLGFAVAYASTSLVEFLNYFYRGLSRSDIESTLTIAQRGATLVLAVAVLIWRPDVTSLAVAMLLPAIATASWSARIAAALRPATTRLELPRDSFVRDVFPIGLGIVLSALYFRIDVVLVELWVGTEGVAGYSAVFRIVDALRLFPAAVLAVILPSLCTASSLRPLARVAIALTAFGAIVAALLWSTADRLVPLLFGERYAGAVPTLRILALSFPLLSLNLALTHQLVGWNRQRAYAAVCAIALAVNLALNAWLLPAFSIDGAAWATLGTELCLTGGCAAALWVRS